MIRKLCEECQRAVHPSRWGEDAEGWNGSLLAYNVAVQVNMLLLFMESLVVTYMPRKFIIVVKGSCDNNLDVKILKKIVKSLYITQCSN